jgi:hypothetical protein
VENAYNTTNDQKKHFCHLSTSVCEYAGPVVCSFWLVIGRIELLTQDVDAKVETWPTFSRTLTGRRLRKTYTSIYKRSNSFPLVHVPAVASAVASYVRTSIYKSSFT